MSGRIQSLSGKRRPQTKAPGKKPNAHRSRALAAKARKYKSSALYAKREALAEFLREHAKAVAAASAAE